MITENRLILFTISLVIISGCTPNELPLLYVLPEFEFTTQSGNSFGNAQLQNKVTIIDLIFTRCQGICPIMAASMSDLYRLFEADSQVQFISITVDPTHDTLQVLQQYAADVGVRDERWKFLWAPVEDVVELSRNGFNLSADNLPAGHSSRFVLIDKSVNIRGYFDGLDGTEMDKLSAGIRQLQREK